MGPNPSDFVWLALKNSISLYGLKGSYMPYLGELTLKSSHFKINNARSFHLIFISALWDKEIYMEVIEEIIKPLHP